jgi:CRP-like cAMP-binding protein
MYEDLLAKVCLFQDLSWRERTWIADACRERAYMTGDELLRQDSMSGAGLFIVIKGSVRLSRRDNDASEHELGQLGEGTILGEHALLEDTPSPATIIAAEPTRVLALPIWDFRMTLRDFPDLAIHLIAILGQRLRQVAEPGT